MDGMSGFDFRATLEQARGFPVSEGRSSAFVMRRGSMELRLFHPADQDFQVPHDRDELYMILAGHAVLMRGAPRSPFAEPTLLEELDEQLPAAVGDAILVPAGTPHHFVDMTPDFTAWMLFWGPEGGEPA